MTRLDDTTPDLSRAPGIERRRTPRIEVLGQVHGRIVSLDARMTALDLGAGGFAMETEFPVDPHSEQDLQLVCPDDTSIRFKAQVVYCRRGRPLDRPQRFVSGLKFTDPPEPAGRLLDQLLMVLSFDLA